MPTVSNAREIIGARKKLVINFLAFRKLADHEIERLLAVWISSKDGRKMMRSGGQVRVFTTIGGRDPIDG
jgi:hypothetical protein